MAAFPTSPTVDDTHTYGGTSFKWNGTGWEIVPGVGTGSATGGTIVTTGGYKYHTFTSSGTLTVTTAGLFEILVIAGGGGGGWQYGSGGGGGGGVLYKSAQYIPSGAQTITVGAGGSSASGGHSTIGSEAKAIGGGLGGRNTNFLVNGGGSGGGGKGGTRLSGAGVPDQGYAGGTGDPSHAWWSGGGGGGAGGVGEDASTDGDSLCGDGGLGTNAYSAWATATSTGDSGYFASGGGGNSSNSGSASSGGGTAGSGGAGAGTNAAANTGGGAGGSYYTGGATYGMTGGSGLVIVRYAV